MVRRKIEICGRCPEFREVAPMVFECKLVDMWGDDFGSCYKKEDFERQYVADDCLFLVELTVMEHNKKQKDC